MDEPRASENCPIVLLRPDSPAIDDMRTIAVEVPVSLEFNGIAYAVMMATPKDLQDFAVGFALSERLIASADEMTGFDLFRAENGWIVRANLAGALAEQVFDRARKRVAESSCGLCGMDNLDAVMRPLPELPPGEPVPESAIFHALDTIREHQPLNRQTGAVHAAAFARRDGAITLAREDVGRHNALDKLVGALAVSGQQARDGFLLTTSRCSYEIVEKAVIAGATTLVTISAPTSLAVERAAQAGLTLIALARHDSAWRIAYGLGKSASPQL